MNTISGGKAPMPPWHNHAVADLGQPAKASHISKAVLSIVKFGGPSEKSVEAAGWQDLGDLRAR